MQMFHHRPVQTGAVSVVHAIHALGREAVAHLYQSAEAFWILAATFEQLKRASAERGRTHRREYAGQMLFSEIEHFDQIWVAADSATCALDVRNRVACHAFARFRPWWDEALGRQIGERGFLLFARGSSHD